jgi:hypothetical protein
MTRFVLLAALVVALLPHRCPAADEARLAHRWLLAFRDFNSQAAVQDTLALLPRAKAAGYNAVVLADSGLSRLSLMPQSYVENIKRLRATAEFYGIDLIPTVMPFGYSLGLLAYDRNLAEGLPVRDALFVARGGVLELVADPPVSLWGGGFEASDAEGFDGWSWPAGMGEIIFPDREVVHTGSASLRVACSDGGPCGLTQAVKVRPFRQYHLSVWVKTEGFERPTRAGLLVLTDLEERRQLSYIDLRIGPDDDWREHHIVFNSLGNDQVIIALGVERAGAGRIWWDDVSLEEIGLVNVLRRAGCPISVRGEDGIVYQEGRDFEPIKDPLLDPFEVYHQAPTVRLTEDSRVREGARLRVSYYHSVLIHTEQVVGCLSEPAIYDLLRQQVQRINDLLHPPAFLMQHDEIRVANWCQACQSRGLTPGQLLADNVRRCVQIIRDVNPNAKIWVWSDMFDPMHNARDEYYLVNGSWRGSWEGLDPEIGIVNWAGHLRGRNFSWFADRGHEQVLAGYYDWDAEGDFIAHWLKAGAEVPRITGAMYATWRENFDHIEAWAGKAWGVPEGQ